MPLLRKSLTMAAIGKKLFETSQVPTTGLGGFFVTKITQRQGSEPQFSVITDGRSPDEIHAKPKDRVTENSLGTVDTEDIENNNNFFLPEPKLMFTSFLMVLEFTSIIAFFSSMYVVFFQWLIVTPKA